MKEANVTTMRKKSGPKPRITRDDLRALIRIHRGNVSHISAAIGMTRQGVINAVQREGLQAEVDLVRKGFTIEPPAAGDGAATASTYPLLEVLRATREVLGERLANGERPAVMQWLNFLRSLNAMGVLRPVDYGQVGGVVPVVQWSSDSTMRLDPGVIAALRSGRVTPDEVITGYGAGAAEAILEAMVTSTKPAKLQAALRRTLAEYEDWRVTDFFNVLTSLGIDVAALLPDHLRRRGGRPAIHRPAVVQR